MSSTIGQQAEADSLQRQLAQQNAKSSFTGLNQTLGGSLVGRNESILVVGDSIFQGGLSIANPSITAFSGNGLIGSIVSSQDYPPGSTFFMNGFNQFEWNGRKTVLTNDGTTITFTNYTALTAKPTLNADFGAITIASDVQLSQRNIIRQANQRMGLPFSNVMINAMSGSTTAYQLARFDTDVGNYVYHVMAIQTGHNDVSLDNSTTIDVNRIFANIVTMINKALNAGAQVWVFGMTPFTAAGGSGTDGTATVVRQQALLRLDQLLRNYAMATPGCLWIDTRKRLGDVASANWKAASNTYSQDGTHPTCFSSWELADELYQTVQYHYTQPWPLISNNLDNYTSDNNSKQLIPDPMMQSSGASGDTGMTGNVWSNWRVYQYAGAPTATLAVGASPDGVGNSQKITVTAAIANDQIKMQNPNSTLFNAWLALYGGKQCRATIAIKQASFPANSLFSLGVFWEFTVSGFVYRVYLSQGSGGLNGVSQDGTYALASEVFILPNNITNAQFNVVTQFRAVGTNGVLEVWRPALNILN